MAKATDCKSVIAGSNPAAASIGVTTDLPRRNYMRKTLRRSILVTVLLLLSGCLQKRNDVDFEKIITTAKEKVYPALVCVKPVREEYRGGEKQQEEVLGSGVIISPDGLVVTNNHVAKKAIGIRCVLWNKTQMEASIVGQDPETDVALLRLQLPQGHPPLPYARFGDSSKVTEGDFVLALGSPFGFTRSVSLGIISNTQRYIGFETIYKYNTWIQTDAAINPGNSGGPLVNTEGKIIGINTLGLGGSGVGFAVPSNIVKKVVDRILKDGRVVRAWIGVSLQALKDFHTDTFIDAEKGVLISYVEPGSPAHQAGMKANDILLSINGKPVDGMYAESLPRIRWMIADLPIGKPSLLEVERRTEGGKGRILSVKVVPVEKGKFEGEDFDCKRWDFTVKEISQFRDPDLFFYRKKGVYVRGIQYPGNAQNAGLERMDIILKIDGKPVESLADVKRIYNAIMKDEKREKKVTIEVLRSGYKHWVVLDYSTDYDKEE